MATLNWNPITEAHEIIDGANILTDPSAGMKSYKSGEDPSVPGTQEITDEAWTDYTPPPPYIKNSTRNLQFNESAFVASPGAEDGVTVYDYTSDGYSWAYMSDTINAMWPYNAADYDGLSAQNTYYAGNLTLTPGAGVVKVTANYKNQYMKFYAESDGAALDRYFVTDQWGNEYVMHASGTLDDSEVGAAFEAAVLPEGWTKSVRQLDADLVIAPAVGSDGTYHYTVWRDSADNAYHQTAWSGQGSLAGQVEGMPIWAGQSNDTLAGDGGGAWNDLLHGAGGADLVSGGAGGDTVWGDGDGDTLSGGGGADLVYGNQGDDSLSGGADDDTLFGGQGGDVMIGGAGSDWFFGNQGDDTLTGGDGGDRFAFGSGGGADTITDLAGDIVVIESGLNGTAIQDLASLKAAATETAGTTTIDLGGGNSLTLTGVGLDELTEGHFLFV